MADSEFDIVIVGGGPGGYVAAIRAAQLGFDTAVIEREHLGGICLNWGCIPTKALLRSSEVAHLIADLPKTGFEGPGARPVLPSVVQRSRDVAAQLSRGVGFLLKKHKVTVIDGTAKLVEPGVLSVNGGETVKAKDIILATGARAKVLPHLQVDDPRVWTYREAMVPDQIPERLLVVGSGAIGMEFASFFADMGSDVTVVEALDRILPNEDKDISKEALKTFKRQGITFHTKATVDELVPRTEFVRATIQSKSGELRERFDRVILAIGIEGNVEDLGLEELGVKTTKGHIDVDEWGATNVPGIHAIGDVAGAPWLAHKASHEGVVCVEKIAGEPDVHPINKALVPSCTYCRPQIASVGLTEAQAKKEVGQVAVGKFPFSANGKALALGDGNGFVKTVFDKKTGRLLGAHMIGPEVTELIQGYVIACQMKATKADLAAVIFPHPTLSEAMHEAALDAFGDVIHV